MRRERLYMWNNMIPNSFVYVLACVLSPFLSPVLKFVLAGIVAVCLLAAWQDSIQVLHWLTVLHNLDKKWTQEHLINLRAEIWPWWSRHTVSSINHWRSKFSLIPAVPPQVVWTRMEECHCRIASKFTLSCLHTAGSGLSNPHMAEVLWKKFPPFWHRRAGSSPQWYQLPPFQSQAGGVWIPLTSQMGLTRTPSSRKALLIIVLHLHRL